jgi:two-component system chemotaxis response regulator CheB
MPGRDIIVVGASAGGVAVVQDPAEAAHPSMPANAVRQVEVDYVLRLAEMPAVLVRLAREEVAPMAEPAPDDMRVETKVAMGDNAIEGGVESLGPPSAFTCPECRGSLLELKARGGLRFRCHTGHAYSAGTLLAEMTGSVEDTLWGAVRAVQESALLMRHIARHAWDAGDVAAAAAYERKAAEAEARAELVRRAVTEHETLSGDSIGEGPQPVEDGA